MKHYFFLFFFSLAFSHAYTQIYSVFTPINIQLFDYRKTPVFGISSMKNDTIYFENGKISSISSYPIKNTLLPINNQQVYKTVVFYNRCGEAYLKSDYVEYGNPMMYGIMGPQYTKIDTKLSNTTCFEGIKSTFSQKP
jgi:hypothetical protein